MDRPSKKAGMQAPDLAKLRQYLSSNVQRHLEMNPPPSGDREAAIKETLDLVLKDARLNLPQTIRAQVLKDLLDEMLGYGPIQPLLDDAEVTEVMVNAYNSVYVERNGKLEHTGIRFESEEQLRKVIESIVLPLGKRVDRDSPMVDARLPDGSRVNAVIQPVSIDGAALTIRKFAKEKLQVQDLIDFGSMTETMGDFLEACVRAKLNIIISGGTGSGKTTLLNILSSFIPSDERIVTIEDAAELQLQQDHVVRLETQAPNIDGRGEIRIRDLVINSLRMRPDRIIVGEVRGPETLDMLQAMNTGHDGSLTTVHANTPRDAIARLETMTLMTGLDLPIKNIRQQIASAVDVIVQQTRLQDGSRKVTFITEVAGMEGDTVVMTDIFRFSQTGIAHDGTVQGELVSTGIRPMFMKRLEKAGFKLGASVFMQTSSLNSTPIRTERRRHR